MLITCQNDGIDSVNVIIMNKLYARQNISMFQNLLLTTSARIFYIFSDVWIFYNKANNVGNSW
jgi:hypothetical protein